MARAWVLVVFVSGAALGGERVRVAVHPIVAPGVDDSKLVTDLNREMLNILAATQKVTIAASEDVERRLAEEGGRCPPRGKERVECLERVALASRASYSIAVVVTRLGREYELSATIACSDRVVLEQPDNVTATDNGSVKIDVTLKSQLRVLLLDRLKVAALPADPRTRNPAPVTANPNPPPVVVVENHVPPEAVKPIEMTISTLRIGSYAAGGFALVSGGAAILLAVMAKGEVSGLMLSSDGVLTDASQVSVVNGSRTKASIAAAMGGVAGAAAVAAVLMFLFSPAQEPKTVIAPTVSNGGVGVSLSGSWP